MRRLKRKSGRIDCYWVAEKEDITKGFRPKTVRLRADFDTEEGYLYIAEQCQRLQMQLRMWRDGLRSTSARSAYGTVAWLCESFLLDEASPLRERRRDTQIFYERYIKIITQTFGKVDLGTVTGIKIRAWHKEWSVLGERGAYACIQTLRRIVNYGCELAQKDGDPCLRLATVLSKMEFKAPKGRKKRVTHDLVMAFRPKAHEKGRASIALAVTLQFDLGLRQKDVIGEWVRAGDGSRDGIMDGEWRWQIGLTWAHIDSDWILRKPTSKSNGNEIAEHDLKAYPESLVLLQMIPQDQRVGPVILDEGSGKPYRKAHFARTFRKIAKDASWPNDVWNMDSRAGAVSEAFEAGAEPADVMKAATHTQISTTMGYNRGGVVQSNRVAELRLAKRSKSNG
ncbi:hypothetical protein EV560_106113 [Bosea sp. BK604]|nr:hypothetical protein EV560_106113 [Bosea sp. BK604]